MKENLIVIFFGCFFFTVGLFGLVWPEKIRAVAIKYSEIKVFGVDNPYLAWIKSPNYLFSMRIIGFFSILASLLAWYVIIQ
ncbi:MAG: hypothetical protein K8S13_04940 [Desulfobacula sp.]|uniref:hypothetical protein n=1 Tax=Desulfobacula sp. TaxID=2593537 RepID=UPI0025C54E6C|nr:hypothetical protein [Desulfobacula sp.]MCD4719193.1 hypothetical protein [Desulfobacula sp.]